MKGERGIAIYQLFLDLVCPLKLRNFKLCPILEKNWFADWNILLITRTDRISQCKFDVKKEGV